MTAQSVTLRHATTADEHALQTLAALESTRVPAGPFLIAEVGGRAHAALSLSDGTAASYPVPVFADGAFVVAWTEGGGDASRIVVRRLALR